MDDVIWSEEPYEVCELIGHRLRSDNVRDKGYPGRFNAWHAEKQIVSKLLHERALFGYKTGHSAGMAHLDAFEELCGLEGR